MVPFMVWCWCCVEPPGEKKIIDLEDIPEIFYSPQIKKIKILKLPRYPARDKGRVREMYQSCQTWPVKFGQIWLRTDTRLVFCNRKLMRTDIFSLGPPNPYAISRTLIVYTCLVVLWLVFITIHAFALILLCMHVAICVAFMSCVL